MSRTIVVFWDDTFPTGFARPLSQSAWRRHTKGMTVRFVGLSELQESLLGADLFVNPYGPMFPVEGWSAILTYLQRGGNFLNWGEVPFRTPVAGDAERGWRTLRSCTNYHRKIGIVQSYIYSGHQQNSVISCHPRLHVPVAGKSLVCPDTYPLTVRLADYEPPGDPDRDDGASSTRDADYCGLIHSINRDGIRVAAPITRMDRLGGLGEGGRWVFVTMNLAQLSDRQLKDWLGLLPELLKMASEGVSNLEVFPALATYMPGEIPSLRVCVRIGADLGHSLSVHLTVRPPKGRARRVTRKIDAEAGIHRIEIPMKFPCEAGYYDVEATLQRDGEVIEETVSGFWGRDNRLLKEGAPFSTDSDMIRRGNQIYPLIGSTYMSSQFHRKFLWWANPGIWERDFAEMAAEGVRVIRTGIWVGHHNFMLESGWWREDVLRALDAFILTAQKYEIPVIFTFFAFTPPEYGGENAYLSPRALAAQQQFVEVIVKRYRDCPGLMWDWINEPSVLNPNRLWMTRPNGDRYELEAWRDWLKNRHHDIDNLRDAWHVPADEIASFEDASVPSEEDFVLTEDYLRGRRPLRALDFMLFSQDVFTGWASALRDLCRSLGSDQLMTVGQDEGGCFTRPSPMHHAHIVDFTSVHTWWQNDSLLWDGIVTKVPGVPNLVEETGAMYIENLDGEAWRTEDRTAALIERKYLYSLASASAGTIQWIWNCHSLTTNDNEVSIGFTRADGTKKPEFGVHRRMARFWWKNREYWAGRREDSLVLIIPMSAQLSVRSGAVDATRRAVKVLTKGLHTGVQAVSELDLSRLGSPRMVILPSPGCLSDEAWRTLMEYVDRGGTLIATGVLERDPYLRLTSRLGEAGIPGLGPIPVAFQELLFMNGEQYLLTFSDLRQNWVEREAWTGEAIVWESRVGQGNILYSPLPLELADQFAPAVQLYRRGMELAGVEPELIIDDYIPTTFVRLLRFAEADLVVAVNEANDPVAMSFSIRDVPGKWRMELLAQRGGAYLIHRKKGVPIDQY